jgi:predicted nucleic acid-binding protein
VRRTTDDPSYHADAEAVIRRTTLIAVSPQILLAAGLLQPWTLRSLDAIHLATALSLGDQLDAMAVYDARLAESALNAGLSVVAPGTAPA